MGVSGHRSAAAARPPRAPPRDGLPSPTRGAIACPTTTRTLSRSAASRRASFVTDLGRAVAFYSDALGFRKVFENGDPVGFVILVKDDAELHLSRVREHRPSTQNVAHLMVDDAAAIYEHCVRHGVRIVRGLRDAGYGMRRFVFAGPDGNRMDVGQDL